MFQSTLRTRLAALLVVSLVLVINAGAEIPQYISYQGKVTDTVGNPVADGSYTMRFRIYNASTGGSLLWDSGTRSFTLSGGVANVLLGESPQPALDLAFDADYWLLVTFAGVDQSPRVRLASAGYSYMASGLVPGTEVSGAVYSGTDAAIKGTNTATFGCGIWGAATATTGDAYGGVFESSSPSGRGIQASASSTTGTTWGVVGISASTSGRGVYGMAAAASGTTYGVQGLSASTSGRGVYGSATAASGTTYGVEGLSSSTAGQGLHGEATAASGTTYGVYGKSSSTSGRGVFGLGIATTGVNYGVYGEVSSPSGYAGYFQGNARVTGNLTVDGTLSGSGIGDITSVNAGTGLDGGAMSGDATLSVEVPFQLTASNADPIIKGVNTMTSGQANGVYGSSASTQGEGVRGYASALSGSTDGGSFSAASTNGHGVYAYASATEGANYGMYGASNSMSGWGVFGHALATEGSNKGVEGESNSTNGIGVRGVAGANTGAAYGGEFQSNSTAGRGVYGHAVATTGETYGGYFRSRSVSGWGVYGVADIASNADRFGVYGYCYPDENWGIGVKGEGGYRGVHGVSIHTTGSHTTYGVYGEASGGAVNYGVYASGNLGASGTKSAIVRTEEGPKAVYCLESTEVWFEDFGKGILHSGTATVQLDGGFLQTVNIDESHPMMVFITPGADIGRWWVEEGTREFQLLAPEAPDGAPFTYRVVAKRSGYEDVRLEPRPDAYGDHFLYPSISDVPATYQAEWLKSDAARNEKAPDRFGEQ